MMAMLCFVALTLPADAVISGRTCTDVATPDQPGKDFLDGEHLRIGFSINDVTIKCDANAWTGNGNANPCALYGSIDRETNKEYDDGVKVEPVVFGGKFRFGRCQLKRISVDHIRCPLYLINPTTPEAKKRISNLHDYKTKGIPVA